MTKKQMKQMGIDPTDFPTGMVLDDIDVIDIDAVETDEDEEDE